MRSQITPKDTLDNLLNYWWVIIVFMLLGAVLGKVAHSFFPPIYETHASMGISIDYSRTGLLTDIEEDQIFGTIADVFSVDVVVDEVLNIAHSENIEVDRDSLKKNVVHERTDNTWLFRSQNEDPVVAARLANIWIDEAFHALDDAYTHTLLADKYHRYLDSLTSCLESMVASPPVFSTCEIDKLDNIQAELVNVSSLVKEERQKSFGIVPGVSFRIESYADVPTSPIRYNQNLLIVSGSLVGLILSLWFVNLPFLQFFRGTKHNV